MNDHGRRRLGILVGVGAAGLLLPGITLGAETVDAVLSLLLAALITRATVLLLSQLTSTVEIAED
ncbi:hypothetical protein OG361_15180 [Streptomyces sp. NBC_00090]|uniref:hypothetical protein n=1 Tax=Streptomyces sp. NBC_00090 TaxID=2903619 RepID=UPI003254E095